MTEEYRLLPPVSLPPPSAGPVLEQCEASVRACESSPGILPALPLAVVTASAGGTPTMQPPGAQHISPPSAVKSAPLPRNDPLRNTTEDIVVFKEIEETLRYDFRISKRTSSLSKEHGISLSERGCSPCPACSQTILMGLFDRHMESCSRRDVMTPSARACARAVAESCRRDQCVLNDTSPPPFPFHTRICVTDFVFNLNCQCCLNILFAVLSTMPTLSMHRRYIPGVMRRRLSRRTAPARKWQRSTAQG